MASGKCSLGFIVAIVAIIVLMGLILFPMFARTSCGGGRQVTCMGNLKQCAQALKMYADDYNGQLPSSYLVSNSQRWNTMDFLTFATEAGKLPPNQGIQKHTWPQVLYDNMRSKDIMFCPSDPVDKTDPDSQTSYWYKLANDKAWYGIGCSKPHRNMKDYGYESDQIAFYEHNGRHFGNMNGLKNNTQITASFMDTHVEVLLISNATSGDPINCAANSDGEPMYYNTKESSKTGNEITDSGPAKHTDPTLYYDIF